MTSNPSAPADPLRLADVWAREVLAAAEALRQTGHHKRLRDVTIVLPIDLAAVEAIELACLALAQGELSDAADEFAQYLRRLATDPAVRDRFPNAVRTVIARAMPPGADTPV
jgi:hypothetical protein